MNTILFRRRHLIFVPENTKLKKDITKHDLALAAAINRDIEQFGFSLTKEAIDTFSRMERDTVLLIYRQLIENAKKATAANVTYHPMYPNFPEEVMEMDDMELYLRAICHYIGVDVLFDTVSHEMPKESLPIIDDGKKKPVGIGSEKDLTDIMANLLASSVAYSEQDKEDLAVLIPKLPLVLPCDMKNKENLVFVTLLIQSAKGFTDALAMTQSFYKTATDVKRLYVGMCGGDISLAKKTEMKSLKAKEQKFLLGLLENCHDLQACMRNDREFWKIFLRQYLHVARYGQFKRCNESYSLLTQNKLPMTEVGMANEALRQKNYPEFIRRMAKNPGNYIRQFDYIVRTVPDGCKALAIDTAKNLAEKVSPVTLLEAKAHFLNYANVNDGENKFCKNKNGKTMAYKANRVPLDTDTLNLMRSVCDYGLMKQYADKGNMGKVYVEDGLEKFKAPLAVRNTSKTCDRMIMPGSVLPVDMSKDTIRLFCWWGHDADIDLSASFINRNGDISFVCSYYELKNPAAVHSGDFTHWRTPEDEKNGLCEFIDIDIAKMKENGCRYATMEITSFSGQLFKEVPVKCGFMERDRDCGGTFEPRTVKHAFDVTANSTNAFMLIFDVEEGTVTIADSRRETRSAALNLASTEAVMELDMAYFMKLQTPNMMDVIAPNILARRGILVDKMEDADYVFTSDDSYAAKDGQVVITPYDFDKIIVSLVKETPDPYAIHEKDPESEDSDDPESGKTAE